jgi:uncharacterized repeat protein (TIGR03803 family)
MMACAEGQVAFTNLVLFNGANGSNPSGELTQEVDGSFYGTTTSGGVNGYGTVFRIASDGQLVTLISFNNTNGASPYGRLAQGSDGWLYGTTSGGGSNGYGTVFKLATNGSLASLMSFNSTNGAQPRQGLAQGSDGQFYGTAAFGGTNGGGTLFRIATNNPFSSLFSFDARGYTPYGGVVQGPNGNFYGTTFQGGAYSNGIVYQLTTNGGFTVIYSFKGSSDGANSYAGLIQGTDGNFYGTTFYGGSNGFGTIFKVTPGGAFSSIFSFGGTNGAYPQASLLQAADGNFYGTTQNGGPYTNQFGTGYGTVFRLGMDGTFTSLFSFNGTNGGYPRAGLTRGVDGSFYGTTTYGGTSDNGTVFRLTVSAPPSAPEFLGIVPAAGAVVLTWSAVVGQQYQMLRRTNLELANWTNLGGIVTATNTVMTTVDSTGSQSQMFYRIKLLSGP